MLPLAWLDHILKLLGIEPASADGMRPCLWQSGKLENGKKSVGFAVILQAADRFDAAITGEEPSIAMLLEELVLQVHATRPHACHSAKCTPLGHMHATRPHACCAEDPL